MSVETCRMVSMSNARPTSPRPPTFPVGSTVAFDFDGRTYTGTFIKRTSHATRCGANYIVDVDGRRETIFANGMVGRTMRAA